MRIFSSTKNNLGFGVLIALTAGAFFVAMLIAWPSLKYLAG